MQDPSPADFTQIVAAPLLAPSSIRNASAKEWLAVQILCAGKAILLVYLAIAFGLVHFGLLTTLVAVFTTNALGNSFASSDLSAWFMPYTIATMVLVAAIALFAFWRSLDTQSLVGDTPQ